LNRGDANRSRPHSGDQSEGQLSGGGNGRCFVECLNDGPECCSGNDQSKVMQEFVIDVCGRAGGNAENEARAEQGREEREEEVEAEFCRVAEDVVCE